MSAHLISRRFMPQIDEKDLVPALANLTRRGIFANFQLHPASTLVGHQAVDEAKVEGIMKNEEALSKPLLIASHGFVLDGNHRAEAHKRLGSENVIAIVIPLPYEDALLALAETPQTYAYGDGHEHPITQ